MSEGTLMVHSEDENSKVLLQSKIRVGSDIYHKQQATLIVWSEDEMDLALSFQEAEGCTEIWGDISKVMRADDLYFPDSMNDLDDDNTENMTLPDPNISNLREIDSLIKSVQGNAEKEKLFTLIVANFLTKRSKFKQIVPIRDPRVEQKIHQVFRLQCLRDRVLSRFLDESLSGVLESMIFFHNTEIVNAIHQDHGFLKELFGILESTTETIERKRDVVRFVQQYCSIARTTMMTARIGLYRTLCRNGLFGLFELALADNDRVIKMAGAEIMVSALEHDGGLVRFHIVERSVDTNRRQVFDVLLSQFLVEEDAGIVVQFSELIRVLLDTNPNLSESGMPMLMESSMNPDPNATKFLELFYSFYVDMFVSPLMSLTEDVKILDRLLATRCENICYILSFMVRQHGLRGKNYVLSSGIIGKVCLLLKNRDRHLRLSALKFFRTCIGLSDESYHCELIERDVVQNIVELLLETGAKNNLVNSLCLEFFEYIRTKKVKMLTHYVVANHREKLERITYTDTFRDMMNQYEEQRQRDRQEQHPTDVVEALTTETAISDAEGKLKVGPVLFMDGQSGVYSGHVDSSTDVLDPISASDMQSTHAHNDVLESNGRARRRKLSDCEGGVGGPDGPGTTGEEEESTEPTRLLPNKRKRPNNLATLPLSSKEPFNEFDVHSTSEPISASSPTGTLLSRRSPSPQLSPTSAAMRTGIAFVREGTEVKETSSSPEQEASKLQEAMRLKSELAVGSRYVAEETHLTKRKREEEGTDGGTLGDRTEVRRRSNSSSSNDGEGAKDLLILSSSPMIPMAAGLAMQDNMIPRVTPDSKRKMTSSHGADVPCEGSGGSIELVQETATPLSHYGGVSFDVGC
ncbi:Platinum sensitivity protein [Mortierella sp. NVP85]|nr:Platinum sensitivity protein [Mortierella sp. NVP85]